MSVEVEARPLQDANPVEGDWFLRSFVDLVNREKWSVSITLNVGGILVTGDLVSGKDYFDGIAAEFAAAFGEGGSARSIQEALAKPGEAYEDRPEDAPLPHFIHLKNAHCFIGYGPQIPANRGVWWRGRLSEVQGFNLGSLSAD